jgi:predicted transglutaminase-like cysteine proteinase
MLDKLDPAAQARIRQWCELVDAGRHYPEQLKLEHVNQLINQAEFIYDAPQWGEADYWATPFELLVENRGDCEDFTIAKYFTLREMGMPDNRLRLTYVKAIKLNQAHMVLSYYAEPGAVPLVLDNLDEQIRPAVQRTDLIPIFSFNGSGLWTAKARGDGKLVGSADRLAVWNELRNRMDEHTSQYMAAHAGQQRQASAVWFCR